MQMRYYRKPPVSILPTAIVVIFFRHFLEYHSLPSALLNGLLGWHPHGPNPSRAPLSLVLGD
jgi:hypothetical protein